MSKAKKKSGSQAEGTRRSYFVFDPFEVIIVGIDTTADRSHPLFDPESNEHPAEKDTANIANVRTFGVLKPILFERDGDRILVVDGRTRVRWARCAARLQKAAGEEVLVVPGIPKRGDGAMLYGVSRAANTHRPDDSPMAQARNAQRLIDMGRSEEEAAIAFGVTLPTMREWLSLLSLDPKVQRLVEKGMAVGAAAKLAKLPRSEQVAKIALITADGAKPTARAVTNKIREGNGKAPVQTPAQRIRAIEKILNDTGVSPTFVEARSALLKIRMVALSTSVVHDGTMSEMAASTENEPEFGS
jgi:ParB family chromosome partitioning protein